MTWKEFKEKVEAAGVTDEMEIRYIDVSFPMELSVSPQDEEDGKPNSLGITVTN